MAKKRNVNMDLFRIVSMLLIILLHSVDHSGVLEAAEVSGTAMQLYVRFVYMLTQVCVNCYVLLSGYFLVSSKFRLQKLVALWMEVVFYSFTIKIIFMLAGYTTFSIGSLLSCFMPIYTGRYWFITIYFGLYLIAPFLNIAIHAMNKKQHTILNIILFVLFSIMISLYPAFKGMNSGAGWGLAWFVVLYFWAAWFRKFYRPNYKFMGSLALWGGISVVVALIYVIGGRYIPLAQVISDNWYRYDSVPASIASICLFVAFLNIKIENQFVGKLITIVAPATLGVYLIHAHSEFSPWSWEVLNLPVYMESAWFVLVQFCAVLGIFVVCTLIDLARKYTIGRLENSAVLVTICEKVTQKTLQYLDIFIKE